MCDDAEAKYIKLTDEYYLGADTYNWTLNIMYIVKGKPIFRAIAFCSTLQDIYKYLIERELRSDIEILKNIELSNKLINDNFNKLKEISKNIKRSQFLDINTKKNS